MWHFIPRVARGRQITCGVNSPTNIYWMLLWPQYDKNLLRIWMKYETDL